MFLRNNYIEVFDFVLYRAALRRKSRHFSKSAETREREREWLGYARLGLFHPVNVTLLQQEGSHILLTKGADLNF